MKRLTIFSLTCLFSVGAVFAQQGVTQCGVPTGQPKFPLLTYQELPDPTAPSDKEWAAVTSTQVSWGTTDTRYAKHQLPQLKKQQTVSLKGWRGETKELIGKRNLERTAMIACRTERPEFQLW